MAITTLDGVIAGFQPPQSFVKTGITMKAAGTPYSSYAAVGIPGAGANPSSGLSGAAITSRAGQIPFNNPGSGNTYLGRFEGTASNAGCFWLVDRLWDNSGIGVTTTTAQTVTSATWPARDNNGATTGAGVLIGLEAIAATTNSSAITNTTISYTGVVNGASQTGSLTQSWPATATQGTFIPFSLTAGDTGVTSIQSVTLGTSYVTGTLSLVAYRLLAVLPVAIANVGNAMDALTGGMIQLYNNTCPFLIWIPTATTATNFFGQVIYTQG